MDEDEYYSDEYSDEYNEYNEDDDVQGYFGHEYGTGAEVEFKPEIKAFERVGVSGVTIDVFMKTELEGSYRDLQKKINAISQSPRDRFIIYTDAIIRKLKASDAIEITEDQLVDILQKVDDIRNIEYINPLAFVLGYFASSGGKEITKSSFDHVIRYILPKSDDDRITPPDILRYARYWNIMLKE